MEEKKILLKVIGPSVFQNKTVWSVESPKHTFLHLNYHPAFEKLYPRKSLFPCIVAKGKFGDNYQPDWEEIYRNVYKEDCDYVFKVIDVVLNYRTFSKSLKLEDEYGFNHFLKEPGKKDDKQKGSIVKCTVVSISRSGLHLESASEYRVVQKQDSYWQELSKKDIVHGKEPSIIEDGNHEDVLQKGNQPNDMYMPGEDNVVKEMLFDKLHDSRVATFKELNKRAMRGVWRSVIDKYPDTAHFIYELLQNADDARATLVTIMLNREALVFKHNGTIPFSVSDDDDDKAQVGHINSITGIGDSTKGDDSSTNKIGKFGIGFKSVFQYTDAPEIYDDYYRFRIRNYIVPERINHDHKGREDGETLFYIPFKHPEAAYEEISAKLKVLANVTLFLHNLMGIKWTILTTGETRTYTKKITDTYKSNRNILLEKITLSDYSGERNLLMFSRNVNLKEEGRHKIYVGYYLKEDDSIDTEVRPKVYCFFPTSESFNMCMIMHAPFLLVDNRQQIKPRETTNRILVSELGNLSADTLCELRDLGIRDGKYLLNENIAEIVRWNEYNPYAVSNKHVDETIIQQEAIINPCIEKIKNTDLLLSAENKYLRARCIYHVYPESLAALISASQLKSLRSAEKEIGILCPALNEEMDSWLIEEIGIKEYTTQDFATDISVEFMTNQPVVWVNRLFGFLNNEVRKTWLPDEKNPYFLSVPIIQTTKGQWVSPFSEGHINVYMDGNPDEYNVISNNMRASHQVVKFLQEIGCKEPDQLDFILTHILENYSDDKQEYPQEQLNSDLSVLLKYYYSAPFESREVMMKIARYKFKVACCCGDNAVYVDLPKNIYLDTPELLCFFKGTSETYFFNTEYYRNIIREFGKDKVYDFLIDLGIRTLPYIYIVEDKNRYELTDFQREQLKLDTLRTTYESIYDKQIAGLSDAVIKPDEHMSHILWELVSRLDLNLYRYGTFKYYYRTDYRKLFDSQAIETLRNSSWVYANGKRYRPSKVSLEQFAKEGYEVNYELCSILGINKSELNLAEAGANKEQIRQYEMGKLVTELGLNEEDLKRAAEDKKKRNATLKLEEKREARNDFLSAGREALKAVDTDKFGSAMYPQTTKHTDDTRAERRLENLQEEKDKVIDNLIRKEELEKLRESVKDEVKYSKEWFEKLLTLEYKNDTPKEYSSDSKVISISFGKVVRDNNSERILVLRNPSQPIPLEIETIDRLEVRFEFKDQEEKLIIFEVASVRDFSLRLKAKASDKSFIEKTDWNKCTRAIVNANNPTELMGKLIDAFRGLAFEDGFNFKENLQNNISFVFGPPGTGKTTFVSNQIYEIMKNEPHCRILVLAPTNKACDVITERIASIADNPSWLGRFVATASEYIEQSGLLCNRDTEIYEQDQCCLVSTIARLPYDGFVLQGGAPRLRDLDWEYIIIDEASMIPIAQIVYAIYRFSPYSKVIISGDPLQIPPIAREEQWADENIYTMVNLNRFDNPVTEPIQFDITNLSTQYRSVPAIGEVFSRYSYAGLLKHYRSQSEQKLISFPELPMKSVNIIQFKVERFDNIFGAKKLSGSNVQIYSVLLVVELCEFISRKYKGKETISVGIICPYVAESQMIERLIEQQEGVPENISFNVGTIHGFQGDECDIVIVVFNPPKGMTSQPDRIMLNRKHIINVAVSRAKDYLFILMPHPNTEGFQYLYEIRHLWKIASDVSNNNIMYYSSDEIEQILFGKKFFLENNTFVTSHQMANVYTEPGMKYEVRIDENSVDVQIAD